MHRVSGRFLWSRKSLNRSFGFGAVWFAGVAAVLGVCCSMLGILDLCVKAQGVEDALVYIVAQDGSGDFTTIQEGVDNAPEGSTLLIYPGTYTESVKVLDKELRLEGVDKESCILQYEASSYTRAPLVIAAGTVSNLTIYGMDSVVFQTKEAGNPVSGVVEAGTGEFSVGEDGMIDVVGFKGYAVHVDQDYLYGREIRFEDCIIISYGNQCVGIGSRGESSIVFEGCDLVSMGIGGCLYLHDSLFADMGGETDFIMRDCRLKCFLSPYVMTFESIGPASSLNLTFQNVDISAVAYAYDIPYNQANVNSSFGVDVLARLEKVDMLRYTGIEDGDLPELVHESTVEESHNYIKELEQMLAAGDAAGTMGIELPEGITYIHPDEARLDGGMDADSQIKQQVIAIFNYTGKSEEGWCGLANAYLMPDSYGNTLPEMNAVR